MMIAKLFKRSSKERSGVQAVVPDPRSYFGYQEEADELDIAPPEEIYIKSMPLIMLSDVQRAATELRAGNIVILHIKPILQRDRTKNELKRAVDQLRGICRQLEGDIAQLGGEYIIITPGPFVKIYKPETKTKTEEESGEKGEEKRSTEIGYSQPAIVE